MPAEQLVVRAPRQQLVVDLRLELRCLTHVWRGEVTWRDAVRAGDLTVTGSRTAVREVPRWLNVRATPADPAPSFSAHTRLAPSLVP